MHTKALDNNSITGSTNYINELDANGGPEPSQYANFLKSLNEIQEQVIEGHINDQEMTTTYKVTL